jgi:protein-S-isoprenylcysteine O-methyltransferase Ste14
MYVRLARIEEQEVRSTFGDAYERYAARTPAWVPRLSAPAQTQP